MALRPTLRQFMSYEFNKLRKEAPTFPLCFHSSRTVARAFIMIVPGHGNPQRHVPLLWVTAESSDRIDADSNDSSLKLRCTHPVLRRVRSRTSGSRVEPRLVSLSQT